MGGGSSRPAETLREIYIRNIVIPHFTYSKFNGTIEKCDDICVKYQKFGWGIFSRDICVQYEKQCRNIPGSSIDLTTKYLEECLVLLNTPQVNSYEANEMIALNNLLIKKLEEMILYNSFRLTDKTKEMVQKIVDYYFEIAKILLNYDNNIVTQYNASNFYMNTILKLPGKSIDIKFLTIIIGCSDSAIYHSTPTANGDSANASLNLFNLYFEYLMNNIVKQLKTSHIVLPEFSPIGPENMRVLFNICTKIIDAKQLNKYADGEDIEGLDIESISDEDIKRYNIFENLEMFKLSCKYLLFLYRKKICTNYMTVTNHPNTDYNTYRNCKIIGVEAKNKPPEEIARIKDKEEEKNEKDPKKTKTKDNFTQIFEHFDENGIFKQVEKNLKLVLGYVIVLIIMGILIALAPSIFNTVYGIIEKFLIPAFIYILGLLTDVFTIIAKSFILAVEGLFFFVSSIIGSILGLISITTGLTIDFIKDTVTLLAKTLGLTTHIVSDVSGETVMGATSTLTLFGRVVYDIIVGSSLVVFNFSSLLFKMSYEILEKTFLYFIDQFSNIFVMSKDTSFTIVELFSKLIGLVFKIIYDAGYGTGLLIYDLFTSSSNMAIISPISLLGMISKNVFENSRKIFMTINNIEE